MTKTRLVPFIYTFMPGTRLTTPCFCVSTVNAFVSFYWIPLMCLPLLNRLIFCRVKLYVTPVCVKWTSKKRIDSPERQIHSPAAVGRLQFIQHSREFVLVSFHLSNERMSLIIKAVLSPSSLQALTVFQRRSWLWWWVSAGRSKRRAGYHILRCTLSPNTAHGSPLESNRSPQ